jgi:hypothetical protein
VPHQTPVIHNVDDNQIAWRGACTVRSRRDTAARSLLPLLTVEVIAVPRFSALCHFLT